MRMITNYRHAGRQYDLKERTGDWAIFESISNGRNLYEVIKLRKYTRDAFIRDKQIAKIGDEYIPCANEWGKFGFTPYDLHAAKKLLETIQPKDRMPSI